MTIQSGTLTSARPFFVRLPGGKSTGQRVNKLVFDRSYKPDSADAAKCKSPFLHFFAKYMRHLQHISIIISVRYNPTDRKNRPFGL